VGLPRNKIRGKKALKTCKVSNILRQIKNKNKTFQV
jgi:hypothetical protein